MGLVERGAVRLLVGVMGRWQEICWTVFVLLAVTSRISWHSGIPSGTGRGAAWLSGVVMVEGRSRVSIKAVNEKT